MNKQTWYFIASQKRLLWLFAKAEGIILLMWFCRRSWR